MICRDLRQTECILSPLDWNVLRNKGLIVMIQATTNITQLRQSIKLTEG